MAKPIDTLLATPADLHCGSHYGLTPPNWNLKNGGTLALTRPQQIRWNLWTEAWKEIGRQRKGKRLVIVLNGDLVDGFHHLTTETITNIEEEQQRMAIECIETAMSLAKFGKGDRLFVVEGTETHTNGSEDAIARDLDAVPAVPPTSQHENDGRFAHHELRLDINGRLIWIAHHALPVGTREWTKENPLVGALRNVYIERLENGQPVPHLVIGAHYHRPADASITRNGHTMAGAICPPMQNRTRHARRVAPNQATQLGVLWHIIHKSGLIERKGMLIPAYHQEEIGVIKL